MPSLVKGMSSEVGCCGKYDICSELYFGGSYCGGALGGGGGVVLPALDGGWLDGGGWQGRASAGVQAKVVRP